MALFPQQYYAVLPGNPDTGPVVVEVKRGQMFMHVLYMDMLDQNALDTAQYFDVGVLLAADKLPAGMACRVANRANVDGLASGSTLRCWTADVPPDIPYAQGAIRDRQFRLKVQEQPVQLSRVVLLTEGNGNDRSNAVRRLFEMSGPRGAFLEGSPVLNSQREVVALYSKTPAAPGDEEKPKSAVAAGKQQPRAALVDAEMIGALWTGRPSRMWVGYDPKNRSPVPTGARGK